MVKRKSNSRGSLLGRYSKSSNDKTGLYLFLIVGIVVVVAAVMMFSSNQSVEVSEDGSALAGMATGDGTRTFVAGTTNLFGSGEKECAEDELYDPICFCELRWDDDEGNEQRIDQTISSQTMSVCESCDEICERRGLVCTWALLKYKGSTAGEDFVTSDCDSVFDLT